MGRFRVVITGAPASAKSTIIERLKGEPVLAGFVFFDELARLLLAEKPDWRNDWHRFHHVIYHEQCKREDAIGTRSFITDRGTVDAFAFHRETMDAVGTTLTEEYARYDLVLHLGSAASLGERFYVQDQIRLETMESALANERNLREVWQGHPGYRFTAAEPELETKYARVLTTLNTLLQSRTINNTMTFDTHEDKRIAQ